MKPLTSALAALVIAGSLAVGAPALSAASTSLGGGIGCCKDLL